MERQGKGSVLNRRTTGPSWSAAKPRHYLSECRDQRCCCHIRLQESSQTAFSKENINARGPGVSATPIQCLQPLGWICLGKEAKECRHSAAKLCADCSAKSALAPRPCTGRPLTRLGRGPDRMAQLEHKGEGGGYGAPGGGGRSGPSSARPPAGRRAKAKVARGKGSVFWPRRQWRHEAKAVSLGHLWVSRRQWRGEAKAVSLPRRQLERLGNCSVLPNMSCCSAGAGAAPRQCQHR